MCDFHKEQEHTARKEHKCWLCAEPIEVSEKYIAWSSVYQGDFDYQKLHRHCAALIRRALHVWEENEYDVDYVIQESITTVCRDCEKQCNRTRGQIVKCSVEWGMHTEFNHYEFDEN